MLKFSLFSNGKKVENSVLLEKFLSEEVGIFESLRVYSGKIFREEEHLARLMESAKTAGFSFSIDTRKIHKELQRAVRGFAKEEAFVRLTLIQDQIFVMMGERKHPQKVYETGVALKTSPVKRSLSNAAFPEAKTTAYQNAVLASLEPRPEKIYEWIFLDQNGYVTEVRIGNIFIIRRFPRRRGNSEILTPPLAGILNGVTRRFVIECALHRGLSVKEMPLTRHDIYNADEVFLTNTSWEILPVRELDGRPIGAEAAADGSKIPGPETLKLHQIFKQKVFKECHNP